MVFPAWPGTFVGLNYSTNNFLGLGETLSMQSQLGTITRNVSLGFTEPYLFDRPLQAGISVYLRRYNYDQGRQISLLSGVNLESFYNSLGSANVLNYVQDSRGIAFSTSYPLGRGFARAGISIGYDISSIRTLSTGAETYFTYINFLGVNGPNALNGIKTLSVTPSYTYNSKNNFMDPTAGKSIFFSVKAAASVLGSNVNILQPTFDGQYYHVSPRWHRNVLAFHLLASTITGFGGKEAPPFMRSYIGGENDIRGFDFFSVTPFAYMPSSASIQELNPDGSNRTQKQLVNGILTSVPVTLPIPVNQLISPGGDTHAVFNFEYRIPIVGPITMAPFLDAGFNRILFTKQLTVNPGQITSLNNQFPEAAYTNKVQIAPGSQAIRMSTGLEIQVLLPIVQAPFRVYYAYNPLVVREYLQPPIVLDRSTFPNQETFDNAVESYGAATPIFRKAGHLPFYDWQNLLNRDNPGIEFGKRSSNVRSRLITMPVFAVLCCAMAWGQQAPLKIAVIDMQSALLGTRDGQKAVAEFKAKFAPREQEFQKRQSDLKAKQDQFVKTENTMSDEGKANLQRDIDATTKALQPDTQDAQQDAQEEQQRLLNDLGSKVMQVINKYANDNKITMVFDVTNGAQANNLLFASTSIDITRDIIALDDQLSVNAATAPKTLLRRAAAAPPASVVRRPAAPAAPAAK